MVNILKINLLAIMLLFMGINDLSSQFAFGVKLGGTSANFSNIGLTGYQPKQRLYLNTGLEANFILNKRFAIQLEAVYAGKGSQYKYTGIANYDNNIYNDVAINATNKLGYLAVPIMGQFLMGDRENHFHLDFGVVPNLLIRKSFTATADIPITGTEDFETVDINLNYIPAQNDFGLAFGIGLRAMNITFDFRYEVGMIDLFIPEVGSPAVRNKAFTVSLGYYFPIY